MNNGVLNLWGADLYSRNADMDIHHSGRQEVTDS